MPSRIREKHMLVRQEGERLWRQDAYCTGAAVRVLGAGSHLDWPWEMNNDLSLTGSLHYKVEQVQWTIIICIIIIT